MTSVEGPTPVTHVVLAGLMASGKTTVGQDLAEALGWEFDDSDFDIQARTGQTGREIAASKGVEILHGMEADSLLRSLAKTKPRVITAAASTIENAECRSALGERAFVVFLDIDVDLMLARFSTDDHRRSITRAELEAMRKRRFPLFAELADLQLDAKSDARQLVQRSLEAIQGVVPPAKRGSTEQSDNLI